MVELEKVLFNIKYNILIDNSFIIFWMNTNNIFFGQNIITFYGYLLVIILHTILHFNTMSFTIVLIAKNAKFQCKKNMDTSKGFGLKWKCPGFNKTKSLFYGSLFSSAKFCWQKFFIYCITGLSLSLYSIIILHKKPKLLRLLYIQLDYQPDYHRTPMNWSSLISKSICTL